MKYFTQLLIPFTALILASCGGIRRDYSPDGPPTVSMPAKLSDRERTFIPEIDSSLRREGLVPVQKGKGDLDLEFVISEGPIRTQTRILLQEKSMILASGKGSAAGILMIGRNSVADKSFSAAFSEFQASLSQVSAARAWSSGSPIRMPDTLPVY